MLPEWEVSSLCTDLEGFYRHHRLENWKNNLKNLDPSKLLHYVVVSHIVLYSIYQHK